MTIDDWMPILYKVWRLHCAGTSCGGDLPKRPSAAELETIANGVRRLSRGFTGNRALVGSRYLDDPALAGAYLLYYWPISYLQTRSIAADLLGRGIKLSLPLLDCGCGPAPAAFALLDAASEATGLPPPKGSIRLLDHSSRALELATALAQEAWGDAGAVALDCRVWNPVKDASPAPLAPPAGKAWGLVSFSHSLNEFWAGRADAARQRNALLDRALAGLATDGCGLFIEPALRESTQRLLALRDESLASGFPILGPCNYTGPCPAMAAGQTCHGEYHGALPPTVLRLAKDAGLDKDSVAMAWLALGKKGQALPAPGGWLRICSEAMVNKSGRTRYMACGAQGRISLSGKLPQTPQGVWKQFAGLGRGQAIWLENPEARDGGLGITDATIIRDKMPKDT